MIPSPSSGPRVAAFLLLGLIAVPAAARAGERESAPRRPATAFFEANRGQLATAVRFAARGPHGVTQITESGAVLVAAQPAAGEAALFRLIPVGAHPQPAMYGTGVTEGRVHVFHGADPRRWVTHIPTSRGVRVDDLYPGISVDFYAAGEFIEYDFTIDAGRSPRVIRLRVEGAKPSIDGDGSLLLRTKTGDIRQRPPVAYQEIDGVRHLIDARYELDGSVVTFQVGSYDTSRPLVIDPVLLVATYLGGSGADQATAVAFGRDSLFVAGTTLSTDFPVSPAPQTAPGATDAFVARFSSGGDELMFAAYYGGAGPDAPVALAADEDGGVYVAGNTTSVNLPIAGPAMQRNGGAVSASGTMPQDGFLAHFRSNGELILSTYFGSTSHDGVWDIALGPDLYILGWLGGSGNSFTIPIAPGPGTAFLFRLTRDGQPLGVRLLPGDPVTLAVGPDGAPYVGGTGTAGTSGAFQSTPGSSICSYAFRTTQACHDGAVSRIARDLSSVEWTTLLRETSTQTVHADDFVRDIAVDRLGNVYVVGQTLSQSFPTTAGAYQTACSYCGAALNTPLTAGGTGFLTKINPSGTALIYSTFFHGGAYSNLTSLALDPSGAAFVGGMASSIPTTGPPLPESASTNSFVSVFATDGDSLLYSSWSRGNRVAVSRFGTAAVTGAATAGATVLNAVQPTAGGGSDAFLQVVSIPRVVIRLEAPEDRGLARGGSQTLRGWAVDTRSTNGAGIDEVHLWAYAAGSPTGMFVGAVPVTISRPDVAEGLGSTEFETSGFTLDATLPAGAYTFVAYGHSSVTGTFGYPAQVNATLLDSPVVKIERPATGFAPEIVTISGFAVDLQSSSGTGVETVHVWGYPEPGSGSAPVFLGVADYGTPRPDIAGAFGDQFSPSGFSLQTALMPGNWLIVTHARVTRLDSFEPHDTVRVTVRRSQPSITIESPAGPAVYQGFRLSGQALDPGAAQGSGIDAVHVWAYPNPGSGTPALFLGAATITPRRDIVVQRGAQYLLSGFELKTPSIAPGTYLIVAYAHSAITGTFSAYDSRRLDVLAADRTVLAIESPPNGGVVAGRILVTGYAFDPRAADGLGVDGIHVWVYPNWGSGAAPYFAGLAYYGQETREDLVARFGGDAAAAGFRSGINFPVGPGTHLIAVFAHSTVTNSFVSETRIVTVPASDPVLVVEQPQTGAVISAGAPFSGFAFDRAAAQLTVPTPWTTAQDGIVYSVLYAYPNPGSGQPAIQVATNISRVSRPDVAAAYGPQFGQSGFAGNLTGLAPGVYDLAYYVWSVISQAWSPPAVVRVTIQ